ncbi:MAG TPA: Ig-like domain-containing protein, partial [Verrucomicrobiae bacterium]|nr:Ig-like domain-containing protein [Verrucomicrobiae bacterium]
SITITGQSVPPNAVADSIVISASATSADLTARLLANDSDLNPDDTARLFISGLYTNATVGNVALTNGVLRYSPAGRFTALAPGQSAPDNFIYVLSDPFGATSSAAVNVTVVGPPLVAQGSFAAGSFNLHILGLSNTVCVVAASTNLADWTVVGTATEASPGVFNFTDPVPPGALTRYYQVVQSPTNVPAP